MQWLKQSTAAVAIVGPFVDSSDGVTAVTFLSSDADAFCIMKQGSTVMFALDSDDLTVTTDAVAFAELTLGTTDVDTLGMLTFVAQDDALCLPVMARFMVVEGEAYGLQVSGTNATANATDVTDLNNLAASDIQTELVTFDAIKSTDGAWASDVAALANITTSDVQAELVTFDGAKSSDVAAELVTFDAIKSTDAAWASDVAAVTASFAASDIAAVADGVWDEVTTDHVAAGTFGLWLDTQISTLSLAFASTDIDDIADAVWDELTTDHVTAATFGLWLDTQVSTLNNIASSDVQAELVTYDAATGTEIGNVPTTNLDSSDIAAELGTYGGALGSDVALSSDLLALNDIASSDVAAELVTYDAATGTEFATLNNLASSDIAAELATYDAATGTELSALNNLADSDVLGYTLETGYTVAQALKLMGSALAGKTSGGGTTSIIFRDLADGANRITATVDSDGDRTAVTLNP